MVLKKSGDILLFIVLMVSESHVQSQVNNECVLLTSVCIKP